MDPIGRKVLPHQPPFSVDPHQHFFFLTFCAKERKGGPLLPVAKDLVESVKTYQSLGKWFPRMVLIMPDHIHGLFRFPADGSMGLTVRNWKRWTTRNFQVAWQDGFFDHRLRQDESAAEKADYILQNPVRAGLVGSAEEWPFVYFGE